jgi:Tol biopolymer transport system component
LECGRRRRTDVTGREFVEVNDPVWSPDGRLIAFSAFRAGSSAIVAKPADGGPERVLIERSPGRVYVEGWSPDGRYVAINIVDGGRQWGALLPQQRTSEPIALIDGPNDEYDFSPDGRWLAYISPDLETGQAEVFVVPVPPTGERWQVSARGGAQPRWRHDGRELFYLSLDGTLMGAMVPSGSRFEAAAPRALFQTGLVVIPDYDPFDVAPDGRFLITKPVESSAGTVIDVVLNWQSALRY